MTPDLPPPLCQRTLLRAVPISATIKARAEDFIVDELPLFDPVGEGEHLYVGVQKRGVDHQEMVSRLARHFGVSSAAVGAAGMKDRHAITVQTVSIHLCQRQPPAVDPGWDDMGFLWMQRHRHRLRRGQLKGNRFSIRLRDIDPLKAPELWHRLQEVAAMGLPDAYGPQRFGVLDNNHVLGWCLLHGAFDQFLASLLGDGSPRDTPRFQESRTHAASGRFREAAALLGSGQRVERRILMACADGRPLPMAIHAAGSMALGFFVSAIQSAVFNRVVDLRLDAKTLHRPLVGDILWRPGAHGRFWFDEARAADVLQRNDIEARMAAGELSASGPMFGREMDQPTGAPLAMEREAMGAFQMPCDGWQSSHYAPTGARRPLRVPVRDIHLESGLDEHGSFVRLAFDLPAGAFATSLLREVLGTMPTDASRRERRAQSSSSLSSSSSTSSSSPEN
ncbi:MAG: tRNA pseudouridine(13) synthase TruD [Planctomycetota bacterium]|nr:tRNA pseudouridine(13) synthase TruD [Planctomycetota bacterium]MDA1105686.1 tRNA pseudouridine(13) synthase TruD [Planctomycetota bacterium]